ELEVGLGRPVSRLGEQLAQIGGRFVAPAVLAENVEPEEPVERAFGASVGTLDGPTSPGAPGGPELEPGKGEAALGAHGWRAADRVDGAEIAKELLGEIDEVLFLDVLGCHPLRIAGIFLEWDSQSRERRGANDLDRRELNDFRWRCLLCLRRSRRRLRGHRRARDEEQHCRAREGGTHPCPLLIAAMEKPRNAQMATNRMATWPRPSARAPFTAPMVAGGVGSRESWTRARKYDRPGERKLQSFDHAGLDVRRPVLPAGRKAAGQVSAALDNRGGDALGVELTGAISGIAI